jgi:N6-L-threonylcarbamoyladenine synthase
LLIKSIKVIENYKIKDFAIAGGVSANSLMRSKVKELEQAKAINTYIPKFEYCTDNAAMIGIVAYYKYLEEDFATLDFVPITRMESFI